MKLRVASSLMHTKILRHTVACGLCIASKLLSKFSAALAAAARPVFKKMQKMQHIQRMLVYGGVPIIGHTAHIRPGRTSEWLLTFSWAMLRFRLDHDHKHGKFIRLAIVSSINCIEFPRTVLILFFSKSRSSKKSDFIVCLALQSKFDQNNQRKFGLCNI